MRPAYPCLSSRSILLAQTTGCKPGGLRQPIPFRSYNPAKAITTLMTGPCCLKAAPVDVLCGGISDAEQRRDQIATALPSVH